VSIRSWQAVPSQQLELEGRVWPVVAQEDLIKALLDGAILLDRAGGCLTVVLQRRPTPLPNEYVTVAAVVQWADRTNAKPQPEAQGLDVVEPEPVSGELLEGDELRAAMADPSIGVGVEAGSANGSPDLADELAQALPEQPDVDESDVPEHLRG